MEILKEKNIVERILTKLSSSCGLDHAPVRSFNNPLSIARKNKRLPSYGFIGGGAICNTILSLMEEKEYPINDIDIFLESNVQNETTGTDRNAKLIVVDGAYNEIMSIESKSNTYNINEVTRDGVFNYVYYTKQNVDTKHGYEFIIKGFDINCCMVGIDMGTKTLYYTKDFEDFLKHRQLMVSNPYTPCHTSLRLLKKKEELGCYLDIEKEMRYLSNVFHLFENPYGKNMNKIFGNFFTEKYKDLYLKYYDTISEYFELITYFDAKKEGHLKTRFFEDEEIPVHILKTWMGKEHLYTFKPKKYNKPEFYLDYIPSTIKGPNSLRKLWNLFERSNKTEISKALQILSPQTTNGGETNFIHKAAISFFFSVDNFHKCDFNQKNLDEFCKNFSTSQALMDTVTMVQLNLQESLNFYKILKNISSKESVLFIDLIVQRIVDSYGYLDKDKIMDKNFLKMIFEEEKTKRSSFLVEPIDLQFFEYNTNVYELVTEYDLMFASRILHNCMSNPGQNYVGKIKTGKTKLFIIETENSYSGVEVDFSNIGYKLRTILGVTNKNPCEKHVYIVNYLINYLNHRHWLLKSNDIMEKFVKNMQSLKPKIENSDDKESSISVDKINRIYDDVTQDIGIDVFVNNLEAYIHQGLTNNNNLRNAVNNIVNENGRFNLGDEVPYPF